MPLVKAAAGFSGYIGFLNLMVQAVLLWVSSADMKSLLKY